MSFTSLIDRFSPVRPSPRPAAPLASNASANKLIQEMNSIYQTDPSNWYTAKPYGFKMTMRDGSVFTFFLPIAPSNLQINTLFATNIIPTLYGTVEEHSDVRYHDIVISGTTGIAPRYVNPGAGQPADNVSPLRQAGRSSFPIADGVSLGGLFSKTLGVLNTIKDKAADLLSGPAKPETGVFTDQSGYLAFHNLAKFLLRHKKDASGADGKTGVRTAHPLVFFNYKDGTQYDVVVRNFVVSKDANNPMLYNYQITMRGYNLQSVGGKVTEDITQRLRDLGLDGIDSSSILGDIKGIANGAKAIVGAASGGINVLGR